MFRCCICSRNECHELLHITKPDRFELSAGVKINNYSRYWMECKFCGLATNILPNESKILLANLRASYYEVDLVDSNISAKYNQIMSLPIAKSDNAGRVDRIIKFSQYWFDKSIILHIMDIGAGTGVFLSRLIDQSPTAYQCTAVEPDPIAADHLRKLSKFNVVQSIYSGQDELRNFNLVTLNKVVEHIEDPLKFLQNVVQSLLSDNGLIYIEVPDKFTTKLRSEQDNILSSMHFHLYDVNSLGLLIQKAGLEILKISRIEEPSGKLTIYAFAAPYTSILKKGFPHERK